MARTYKRDSRGRFSGGGGGGGGGKSRPAPRQVQRGVNRLTRDNAGRITSVGGSGATARGGRIRTAAGNLRATVTSKAGMVSQGRLTGAPLKSTIGKTSKARLNMGLTRPGKPGQREAYNAARSSLRASKATATKPVARKGARLGGTRSTMRAAAPKNTTANKTGQSKTLNKFNSRPVGTRILNAKNQLVPSPTRVPLRVAGPGSKESDRAFARVATKAARARAKSAASRPDTAAANIPMAGRRGKALDASIDQAVKQVKAAQMATLMKPKAQVKAERAARAESKRAADAAKPKRTRSALSLRMSRANQVEKRRGMNISNPAAWRQDSAGRMAANAARTQQRALAFYKSGSAKPAATASRLGSRLNPAKKAVRAATRKFEQAYERENRIRSSLFKGNKSLQTRQAIGKELDKASNLTKTMQMQRRGIRAQFPVQTKDKARRAVGSKPSGTISQNKDIRNVVNRREAFKRKVNRAGALSRPGDDKKARRTTQVRAKAMATYQGARRPEISDSTVGRFGKSRTSTAFRAPASRLAAPSRAARRQGKALALAQKPIRDQLGRRIGNPKKQQRSQKTGSRALSFYQNPKAAAQSVLRDRGNRGLSTKGFRKPRGMR